MNHQDSGFSKMREIKFDPVMLEPILKRVKKFTIRKYQKRIHDLKQHEVFLGYFYSEKDWESPCVLLLQAIADTEQIQFAHIPRDIAQKDGYPGTKTLIRKFRKKFYPDLKPEDTAALIRFRVLRQPTGDFLWKPCD